MMTLMLLASVLPLRFSLLNLSVRDGNDARCKTLKPLEWRFSFRGLGRCHVGNIMFKQLFEQASLPSRVAPANCTVTNSQHVRRAKRNRQRNRLPMGVEAPISDSVPRRERTHDCGRRCHVQQGNSTAQNACCCQYSSDARMSRQSADPRFSRIAP